MEHSIGTLNSLEGSTALITYITNMPHIQYTFIKNLQETTKKVVDIYMKFLLLVKQTSLSGDIEAINTAIMNDHTPVCSIS